MPLLLTKAGGSAGTGNFIADGRAKNDLDAAAVISACSLSAGAQQDAAYFLIGALKFYSLWSKMTGLYGLCGGTAAAHKVNWKTPGTYDIQNAANATWTSGVTHNSNGITGNGTSGYGDTGLAPIVIGQNSAHISIYSRTSSTEAKYATRSTQAVPTSGIIPMWTDSKAYVSINSAGEDSITVPDGAGLFTVTRTGASTVGFFKGSRKLLASTRASVAPSTINLYICCSNNVGTAASFSARNYAFYSAGSGLTDQDAYNLSMIVQSYQTILGRAV